MGAGSTSSVAAAVASETRALSPPCKGGARGGGGRINQLRRPMPLIASETPKLAYAEQASNRPDLAP